MNHTRPWLSDILAIIFLVALTAVSLMPFRLHYEGGTPLAPDLIIHFGCYLVLSIFALYQRNSPLGTLLTVFALILYGGFIELVQGHFDRNASFMDFVANALGVATGWFALLVSGR